MGKETLYSLTSGDDNTANGTYALNKTTTGSDNTAQGTYAMFNNTTGDSNAAFGYGALIENQSGSNNVAMGAYAGRRSTGNGNTFLGYNTGSSLSSGDNNVFVGFNACNAYTNTSNTLCIGSSTNSLITGNFSTGILVLGNGMGYTHVDGDLYVTGNIYENTTPGAEGVASNSGQDNKSSSNSGSSDSGNSTARAGQSNNKGYASNDSDAARTNGATEPGVEPGDSESIRAPRERSDEEIRSELDKYARLNDKLNSKETTFNSLTNDINANAEAITSLQTYVANMHQDMNAGFAMNAALSAKAFPAVKGWSFSAGAGFYEDQEALAIGLNYMGEKYGMTFNLAQSQRGGTMANVGVSVSLNGLFQTKKLED